MPAAFLTYNGYVPGATCCGDCEQTFHGAASHGEVKAGIVKYSVVPLLEDVKFEAPPAPKCTVFPEYEKPVPVSATRVPARPNEGTALESVSWSELYGVTVTVAVAVFCEP